MQFTVKQARKYAGLNQDKVADFLEISRSTYIRLENDVSNFTLAQIGKISEITGVPIRDLILPINSTKV